LSTLYIVATPIGNLKDISKRGLEVLNAVSLIACEDTRTSSKFLQYYGISTPTRSLHQHNEHHKVEQFIRHLDVGQDLALITDAGMPGISDPGFLAVRAAHISGHTVSVIPGADALTTALISSGLPSDSFYFQGFLPHKKGRRKQWDFLANMPCTLVLYESPYRILKLLTEATTYLGEDRYVAICRELTKAFEEVVRGKLCEVVPIFENRTKIKGEICVVIAPPNYKENQPKAL
tara:strand:+ start:1074 stop:1775 length:702 start_codon:yes stop_codon:yes gene_type:complete